MTSLVEICEEYGMFIVTSNDPAHGDENYETFSQSEYFVGEIWESDYQTAYDIVEDMIQNQGAETFALHGFPEGLSTQMDQRLAGARAAIADNGATILTEGLNFDKAGAAENIVSQFPDVDAIFSSVETISTVYQPLVNAGLSGENLLNCYDPADGALEAFEDGTLSYVVEGTTLADCMIATILLYNAMSGNKMVDAEGKAPSIEMNYIVADSLEEFENIQKYVTGDDMPFYFDELSKYVTVLDETASLDKLSAFAGAFSLEDVMERHGE
jgi:ABC-type sugar transport system substrate-binding protein